MVTLSLKYVNQSFGPLFAEKLRVMVDNRAGIAETIELSRSHIDQTPVGSKNSGNRVLHNNVGKGRIVTLGAVSWGNRGIDAAGLYDGHL